MNGQTHRELVGFIWNICNLLRGPYKRNEYRKIILPLTVLRRFDCLLAPTKQAVLDKYPEIKSKPETVTRNLLEQVTGYKFYNLSKMQFDSAAKNSLLNDPSNLAVNLNSYICAYSPNVRAIMEKFKIGEQIAHMAEKNILFEVIKAFCSPELGQIGEIDNTQMGYVFEELIRIGAEQANEEAGLPRIINTETGKIHNISPHKLRDAFAVHAVKHNDTGDGLRMLQEHLGHQSFNTTARYRKVAGEEHRRWYDDLWKRDGD